MTPRAQFLLGLLGLLTLVWAADGESQTHANCDNVLAYHIEKTRSGMAVSGPEVERYRICGGRDQK